MITPHDREMAEAFCRGQDLGEDPVVICAWCDPDQVQARALRAQGKRVSHTICPAHAAHQLARARELNRGTKFTNTEISQSGTLPAKAETGESPEGPGRDGNKPLMRNREAHETPSPIGNAAGNPFNFVSSVSFCKST